MCFAGFRRLRFERAQRNRIETRHAADQGSRRCHHPFRVAERDPKSGERAGADRHRHAGQIANSDSRRIEQFRDRVWERGAMRTGRSRQLCQYPSVSHHREAGYGCAGVEAQHRPRCGALRQKAISLEQFSRCH